MKTKLLIVMACAIIATTQRIPTTARGTVVRADSSTTATLPAANSLASGDAIEVMCSSVSDCTVASAGGTIAGGSSFTVASGITVRFVSDGGGWWVAGGTPKANADGTLEGITGTAAAGVGSCVPTSASGTTYTCTVASATYANNLTIAFKPDTTNTGAATVNISSQGAKAILTQGGQTLSAGMLQAALTYLIVYDGTQFRLQGTGWPVPHADGSLTDDFTAYPPTRRVTAGVFAEIGGANTFTGANSFAGALSTKPVKVGTAAPGACSAGEMFFKSDAAAGSNLLGCTATNTWTLLGGVGGGSPTNIVRLSAGDLANGYGLGEAVVDARFLALLAKYTNGSAQHATWWLPIPTNWTGVAPSLRLFWSNDTSNSANTYKWNVLTSCDASGSGTWNSPSILTVNDKNTSLAATITTTTLPITGCTAGVDMRIRIQEGTTFSSTAEHYLQGLEVIWPLS